VTAGWKALYDTPAVGVWLLLAPSILFLGFLAARGIARGGGVEPYAARFVRVWTVVFALAAIADPIATGLLGWPLLPFVLLGDFRVFAILLAVMQPGRPRGHAMLEAIAWTLVVPVVAYGTFQGLSAIRGPQPGGLLWLTYEAAFANLAVFWLVRVVPARVGIERPRVRRFAAAVLAFVVVYYLLWAVADVLILTGHDAGWALRVLPNLLYYGALVPFVYARFFGSPSAVTSASTQAAR
jgi:hypothetical protein